MDPVALILVPGVLGGLAVAWLITKLQRRGSGRASDPFPGTPATDVINMAHIRVAGVGGLGLVAMALAVAWWVPRIGQSLAVGAVLGVLLAAFLIVRRRRLGPMPSSGRRPGANTALSIDSGPAGSERDEAPTRSTLRRRARATVVSAS